MENGVEKPFAVAELRGDGSCSIEPVTVKITFEMCNLDMDSSFILDEMKAHVRFDKKDITPSFFFDAPIESEKCEVFEKMETWNLCEIEGEGSFSSREVNLSLKMQGILPGNKGDKSQKGKGARGKGGKSIKSKSGKGGKGDKSSKTSRSGKSSKGGKGKGNRSNQASKGGKGKGNRNRNRSNQASKGGKGKGNRSDKPSKRGKSSKYSNAKGYYVGKGQRNLEVGENDDETRYLRKQKPCKCKLQTLKNVLF